MRTRGRRVFVIDDDHSVCRSLGHLLNAEGFRVETFESGAAFLARPPPKGEHCLIIDVRMPGMSGPQLRDALRERDRQSPMIFITAHELEMVEQDLGMETVLLKPIEADVLLHAIDASISSFMVRRNHRSRLARR